MKYKYNYLKELEVYNKTIQLEEDIKLLDLEGIQEDLKEFISKGNTLICWVADISDTFKKDCHTEVLYITYDGFYKTIGTQWNYALPLTETELIHGDWYDNSHELERMLRSLEKFNDFIGSKNMKHKHYDLIEEWARTGKQVEVYIDSVLPGVSRWSLCENPPTWDEDKEYRIKRDVVKYKRFLARNETGRYMVCSFYPEDRFNPEDNEYFTKWVDKDWQEVTV